MNFSNFSLVTSNLDKLKEYQSFGLEGLNMKQGKGMLEVDSDMIDVILYKSLEAGPMTIVEDTGLNVRNTNIGAKIKYQLGHLQNHIGKPALFEVYLGLNDSDTISVYKGVVAGCITAPIELGPNEHVMGFDNYFTPDGSNLNLHQLNKLGEKSKYSARFKAINNLLFDNRILCKNISDIHPWEGSYQS